MPKLRSKIGVVERSEVFFFFTFYVLSTKSVKNNAYSGLVVFGLGCIRAWLYSGWHNAGKA